MREECDGASSRGACFSFSLSLFMRSSVWAIRDVSIFSRIGLFVASLVVVVVENF